VFVSLAAPSGAAMKKTPRRVREPSREAHVDGDTMRDEYDFSAAVRGATAAQYREGTNVVVLDPDVSALFPNSSAVNEALRTLARLVKPRRQKRRRGTS
jgi:hypothetical protein